MIYFLKGSQDLQVLLPVPMTSADGVGVSILGGLLGLCLESLRLLMTSIYNRRDNRIDNRWLYGHDESPPPFHPLQG